MELDSVANRVKRCRRCRLWKSRSNAVPGEGPEAANCVLVGEAPGRDENEAGRPFVGRSGRYLDEVLGKAGLRRRDLFITGSVKCHPPRNRNPRRDELASCRQFLDEQISIIDPRIIVLLGRVAATGFLGDAKLEAVRGRMRSVDGRRMLVTYHPAAAMRFPERRIPFEADIRLLSRLLSSPPEP